GELVAQEVVELLERLDEQVVDRKPDRAAPVAVPSEQTGGALPGLVAKRIAHPARLEPVGAVEVLPADAADAVGAEEGLLVEHPLEDPAEPLGAHHTEQPPPALSRSPHAGHPGGQVGAMVDEPLQPP